MTPSRGALQDNPTTPNFLSPINFRFFVHKLPNVNFTAQRVKMPGLKGIAAWQPNPMVKIPQPYDHLEYDYLDVDFKVDEDLQNYLELHVWIKALGGPDNLVEAASLRTSTFLAEGVRSDVMLQIQDAERIPKFMVTFRDAIPFSLGGLEFDATDPTVEFLTASVSFVYTSYNIARTN